jgi:hypothetical protein
VRGTRVGCGTMGGRRPHDRFRVGVQRTDRLPEGFCVSGKVGLKAQKERKTRSRDTLFKLAPKGIRINANHIGDSRRWQLEPVGFLHDPRAKFGSGRRNLAERGTRSALQKTHLISFFRPPGPLVRVHFRAARPPGWRSEGRWNGQFCAALAGISLGRMAHARQS